MSRHQYDFIVVGSGAGGLAAAVTARLAGMRTLVVEKTSLVGGSTSLSGGTLWMPDNPLMARNGIADSREAALRYLAGFVEEGDPSSSPARREAFVDAIGPMIGLFEREGMRYELSPGFPDNYDHLPGGNAVDGRILRAALFNGNRLGTWKARLRPPGMPLPVHASEGGVVLKATTSWKGRAMVARVAARVVGRVIAGKLSGRTVYGMGAALQGRMLEIALRLGVEIRTDTPLLDLEQEAGKVVGVCVKEGGEERILRVSRGVLMAAAGFAHNRRMREQYLLPPVTTEWTQASPGEKGDAIAAMARAGAAFAWMGEAIWLTTWVAGDRKLPVMSELAKPHSMLVDSSGQRFVNEGRPSNEIGRACYLRSQTVPAVPAWLVADSRARRRYFFAFNLPGRIPKKWVEQGWVKKDDTIAGLARQCGIDPDGLEVTVARFNRFSETGVDEDFQRGDSAYAREMGDPGQAPNCNLGPIAEPPFWAAPIIPGDVGTYGGAVADEYARVLSEDGTVIEGLYATGNCAAPLTGPWYPGAGYSIAVSTVFGHVAARHAAG